MPSIGLSVSASALVGQFLGHERPDMSEISARECVRVALGFMGLMGLLFVLAPGVFLALYAPDAELLPVAAALLRLVGIAQPFMAVAFVLAGALRGAGDTKSVMYATAFSMWGVRLSLTYVFMNFFGWGAAGAWGAMVVDSAVRAGIMSFLFVRGDWKKIRI
jgi:Na+-driven multidrug efflux pump